MFQRPWSKGREIDWYPLMPCENMWARQLFTYVLQDGPTIILLVLANDNTPRHPRPDIDFPTESLMSLLSFVFAVLGPSFSKCPQMLLSLQTSNGYDV